MTHVQQYSLSVKVTRLFFILMDSFRERVVNNALAYCSTANSNGSQTRLHDTVASSGRQRERMPAPHHPHNSNNQQSLAATGLFSSQNAAATTSLAHRSDLLHHFFQTTTAKPTATPTVRREFQSSAPATSLMSSPAPTRQAPALPEPTNYQHPTSTWQHAVRNAATPINSASAVDPVDVLRRQVEAMRGKNIHTATAAVLSPSSSERRTRVRVSDLRDTPATAAAAAAPQATSTNPVLSFFHGDRSSGPLHNVQHQQQQQKQLTSATSGLRKTEDPAVAAAMTVLTGRRCEPQQVRSEVLDPERYALHKNDMMMWNAVQSRTGGDEPAPLSLLPTSRPDECCTPSPTAGEQGAAEALSPLTPPQPAAYAASTTLPTSIKNDENNSSWRIPTSSNDTSRFHDSPQQPVSAPNAPPRDTIFNALQHQLLELEQRITNLQHSRIRLAATASLDVDKARHQCEHAEYRLTELTAEADAAVMGLADRIANRIRTQRTLRDDTLGQAFAATIAKELRRIPSEIRQEALAAAVQQRHGGTTTSDFVVRRSTEDIQLAAETLLTSAAQHSTKADIKIASLSHTLANVHRAARERLAAVNHIIETRVTCAPNSSHTHHASSNLILTQMHMGSRNANVDNHNNNIIASDVERRDPQLAGGTSGAFLEMLRQFALTTRQQLQELRRDREQFEEQFIERVALLCRRSAGQEMRR